MRRLSFKRRIRLFRQARLRAERRRRRAARNRARWQQRNFELHAPLAAPETKSATWRGSNYTVAVTGQGKAVPETLCLEKNRDETLAFLMQVRGGLEAAAPFSTRKSDRRRTKNSPPQKIGSYWDMSCVQEISPAVALMLAAEYERIGDHTGWRPSAIDVHKWNVNVFNLLEEIGFFRLLDIRRSPSIGNLSASTIALKFRSDRKAASAITGKLIDDLEVVANNYLPNSKVNFERLAGAVLEGITNTKQHAYPPELMESFRFTDRWWATGAVDKSERRVSAIIYDQGASIPATLHKVEWYGEIKALLKRITNQSEEGSDDGALIAAAMAVGRSKTNLPYRGKGLADMERFMRECARGRLRVLSRHGEYISDENGHATQFTHSLPIRGTLVQWDVWV
jgi:hypothetical protein